MAVANVTWPVPKKQNNKEYVDFLRGSFVGKECCRFVEQPVDESQLTRKEKYESKTRGHKCYCGAVKGDHRSNLPQSPQTMHNESTDSKTTVTFVDEVAKPTREANTDIVHKTPAGEKRKNRKVTRQGASDLETGASVDEADTPWNEEDCIKTIPTDAFGTIRFYPSRLGYKRPAKYVRLSNDSSMEGVMELLKKHWRLCRGGPPELVVSVIGGGYRFRIGRSRRKRLFNRGLIRAMQTTRGWLITMGLNYGISRIVGDAVKEGQSLEWHDDGTVQSTVHCIGVTPWGMVRNRQELLCDHPEEEGEPKVASYFVERSSRHASSMNPNHTHFLLVDDGTRGHEKGVDAFRADLEQQLAKPSGDNESGVPVVCLLVEGGPSSIRQAAQSVLHDIPVLVCDKTGRAANLISDVLKQYQRIYQFNSFSSVQSESHRERKLKELRERIDDRLTRVFFAANSPPLVPSPQHKAGSSRPQLLAPGDGDDEDDDEHSDSSDRKEMSKEQHAALVDHVMTLCENRHLVTTFRFEKEGDLDLAILRCLMRRRTETDLVAQLRLAFRWNRPDVVATTVFEDPAFKLKFNDRCDLLNEALVQNHVEFVKLFVDHGTSVKHFLTVKRLRELYNATVDEDDPIGILMRLKRTRKQLEKTAAKKKKKRTESEIEAVDAVEHANTGLITLQDVYSLIKRFTRRYDSPLYRDDTLSNLQNDAHSSQQFSQPHHELFLWAIIINRVDLSVVFWEMCQHPLMVAIVGVLLCDGLVEKVKPMNQELASRYERHKVLEQMAVAIAQQAYYTNVTKAMLLLHRPEPVWGNLHCMDLAAIANAKAFLASAACQFAIFKRYKGGINANGLRIVLSNFLVIPVLTSIHFEEDVGADGDRNDFSPKQHAQREAQSLEPLLKKWESGAAVLRAVAGGDNVGSMQRPRVMRMVSLTRHEERRPSSDTLNDDAPVTTATKRRRTVKARREMSLDFSNKETDCSSPILDHLYQFYSSPIAKFVNHTLFYGLFLMLYGYVILLSYRYENFSKAELLLYVWQFTFIVESVRSLLLYPGDGFFEKWDDWYHDGAFATWNRLDVVSYFISAVAILCRFFVKTFPVARLLMALNYVLYFSRVFKCYIANSYLGPKIVMLLRMVWDLAMFLCVLGVLMVAYSVASLALVHGGQNWRDSFLSVIGDVYHRGMWEIFGEPNDDAMNGNVPGTCEQMTNASSWTLDCVLRRWPQPLMLSFYLFFASILLVNMLIAIFTHVFDSVQSNSEQVWRYEMYYLVKEMQAKPLLPPPFIILSHAFLTIRYLCKGEQKQSIVSVLGQRIYTKELEFLEVFEQVCRSDLIESEKSAKSTEIESVIYELKDDIRRLQERLGSQLSALTNVRRQSSVRRTNSNDNADYQYFYGDDGVGGGFSEMASVEDVEDADSDSEWDSHYRLM